MIIALGAAGVFAVLDWWAVGSGRRRLEGVAKPAVMLALIVTAAVLDADPAAARPWIVGGLVLGLIGDVCLLPQIDRFIAGLAAFLVGHLLYATGLALLVDGPGALVLGVAVAAPIVLVLALPVLRGVRSSRLRTPVTVYMVAVATLVVLGVATQRWPIAAGAIAFAVSDGLLGADRFVSPAPQRRVLIHVLYHLGQAGLVLGLHATFA